MGLREDVKVQLTRDWHPKIPKENIILQQAKRQLQHGKSTGSVSLDIKAMKEKNEDNVR